ncbi:CRISPR-associated endonuclease Cas2 [Saprospiraceae bacterium]
MDSLRFNAYRNMWIFVLFDLPTETKKERSDAAKFRKELLERGFNMFQFSIYLRFCQSMENAETHKKYVKSILPEKGKVGVLTITDKQFGCMELFFGTKKESVTPPPQQLTLF